MSGLVPKEQIYQLTGHSLYIKNLKIIVEDHRPLLLRPEVYTELPCEENDNKKEDLLKARSN